MLSLTGIGTLIFGFVALWLAGLVRDPGWEMIALVGLGILALAAPVLRKGEVGKDGGSFEFDDPVAAIERLRDEAKAGREETFLQTRQQIGALSAQVAGVVDLVAQASPDRKGLRSRNDSKDRAHSIAQIKALLPEVTDRDDPQRGRFGGEEEMNGRRLSAIVVPSSIGRRWRKVRMRVAGDADKALSRYVFFFVHDTFDPDVYRVKVDPATNAAELELASYGAYTIGAVADDGKTFLELNLATSPNVNAPKDWRER